MVQFATKDNLASFLGVSVGTLGDVDRVLERASELVDTATMGKATINPTEAVVNATCAQYEYWKEIDESMDITGSPQSFSSGSFSMTGAFAVLAPRAYRILFLEGMMSRGVMGR